MADEEEEKSWFLPSKIPLDKLKGHALEESLFRLLDGSLVCLPACFGNMRIRRLF